MIITAKVAIYCMAGQGLTVVPSGSCWIICCMVLEMRWVMQNVSLLIVGEKIKDLASSSFQRGLGEFSHIHLIKACEP